LVTVPDFSALRLSAGSCSAAARVLVASRKNQSEALPIAPTKGAGH